MPQKKQSGDCTARFVVGSPQHLVYQALRNIHKRAGKYDFVDMETLKAELDEQTRHILNDPENGTLDTLQRMQVVELNLANDFKLRIHQDHWIPFSEFGLDPWMNFIQGVFFKFKKSFLHDKKLNEH